MIVQRMEITMAIKLSAVSVVACFCFSSTSVALAKGDYNDVPKNDLQYLECLVYSKKNYEGGDEPSPIRGQTKAEAFCECLWNETPDDFRGNLAKFSESRRGKEINRVCERYSDWRD
jgi:hypothetical protein